MYGLDRVTLETTESPGVVSVRNTIDLRSSQNNEATEVFFEVGGDSNNQKSRVSSHKQNPYKNFFKSN